MSSCGPCIVCFLRRKEDALRFLADVPFQSRAKLNSAVVLLRNLKQMTRTPNAIFLASSVQICIRTRSKVRVIPESGAKCIERVGAIKHGFHFNNQMLQLLKGSTVYCGYQLRFNFQVQVSMAHLQQVIWATGWQGGLFGVWKGNSVHVTINLSFWSSSNQQAPDPSIRHTTTYTNANFPS